MKGSLFVIFVFVMLSCLFLAAMWSPAGKRVDLFAALCVILSSGFATFPYEAQGQVWYFIYRFLIVTLFFTSNAISNMFSSNCIENDKFIEKF